jgi:hypothetical protein
LIGCLDNFAGKIFLLLVFSNHSLLIFVSSVGMVSLMASGSLLEVRVTFFLDRKGKYRRA